MIKKKRNIKSKYNNLKCRWCESIKESYKHIIEECPGIKQKIGKQRIAKDSSIQSPRLNKAIRKPRIISPNPQIKADEKLNKKEKRKN